MSLDLNAYADTLTGALAKRLADKTKARKSKTLVPVDALQAANANPGDVMPAQLAVRDIAALGKSEASIKVLAGALAALAAGTLAAPGATKDSLMRATDGLMQAVQAAGGIDGAQSLILGLAKAYAQADKYDPSYRAYLMTAAAAQRGLALLEAHGRKAVEEAAKAEAARQAQAAADAKAAAEAAKAASAARLAAARAAKAALKPAA